MLAERFTEIANAFQILVGIVAAVVILTNLKRPSVIFWTVFAAIIVIGMLASQTWAAPIFTALTTLLTDTVN